MLVLGLVINKIIYMCEALCLLTMRVIRNIRKHAPRYIHRNFFSAFVLLLIYINVRAVHL